MGALHWIYNTVVFLNLHTHLVTATKFLRTSSYYITKGSVKRQGHFTNALFIPI